MNEDNLPRKTRWRWPKPSRSDPHSMVEERGKRAASHDPSSLLPSRNGSHGQPPGSARNLFGKVTKRFARSARQSPNPEPTAASSSPQGIQPVQSTKDLAAPILEPNREQSSNSGIVEAHLDPKFVNEKINNATKDLAGTNQVQTIAQNTSSAANNLQSVSDTINSFSAFLRPLKAFNSVANEIANVHPYAKVALSIFTCASKMILDQADRDVAVSSLLSKISEVYTFITEEEQLPKIPSMLAICGKIAQQTLECADFISHYSETKSAWIRLGKHVFDETDATIQNYNNVLDSLMQQFRDRAARDTVVIVHNMAESLDLIGMEYATGAGLNTSKCCLPNTRQDLLKDIQNWISSTEEGAPRILWLSGTAGKGKSAVAHTIANWYITHGGLGACFCFDRTRQADCRQDKIFTTIASELADCNPIMRRALAQAVHDHNGLKRTPDITKQWQELIIGPTSIASKAIAAPVLIVIEALDESGEANSREQILRLLAGKLNTSTSQLSELPANFRILLTSRPLEDIHNILHAASHVRHVSLDEVSPASTELDIQLYVSHKLEDLRHVFNDVHFKVLALKSDGLFEWARLASEYIKSTNVVSRGPMHRFHDISETSAKGVRLLDEMYQRILADIMPRHVHEEAIPIFRSVMCQILASSEPLPIHALNAMRQCFPCDDDRYDVNLLIGHLGSLVSGTSDSDTPIRPLHASFYDFLTDQSRSHDFFVDVSPIQRDLAFASLRVMDSERGLRFNICSLENSYLPNSSVPDLEKRVKESIPAELSYSCRFWGAHVSSTTFESSLAKEVEAFFDGERLLWWLEALALMKSLGGSAVTLSSIADWFSGHAEFMHVRDATRDTLRFVRTFATTILRSTPHLYLSALPFAPTQSRMFRKFAAKFPCTPRIVAGHVVNWPQTEKILHANDIIYSVALSPDGKRIACGLVDGTIQVWDMETGEALWAPLHGHTQPVKSVAFSPDGHRIISGSWDNTVRVWDAKTGEALGSPLQDHADFVLSVAISLDGKYIARGLVDGTIQVWNIETGEAFGAPLQGHRYGGVQSVAISPDGKRIVSCSGDRTIQVWDLESGEALGAPLQGHAGPVLSVAISPDGKHIVSGSADKTIRVWDMETGEALGAPLQGHTHHVLSVAISWDGNRIVSGSGDQTIRIWDLKTGAALGSPLQGHTNIVWSVAISPDGSRIVSGSHDRTVRVWDADTITSKISGAAFQSHTGSVNSVAISPDGHRIVSGSDDQTIRVWDMGTGQPLGAPLQGHTDRVQSVAISSDDYRIVSCSNDASIRVWDIRTGEVLGSPFQGFTGTIFYSIAISPDGIRIISGSSYKTIRVWDMGIYDEIGMPREGHSDAVLSVAISSDRKHIVSGSADQTIRVWNAETGKASGAPLKGHSRSVRSVTVSPDAKCVVSGSADETVRVWDIETGNELGAPLRGHTSYVCSVAISPNGHRIVSGSGDKTIRVWDMKTGEAVGAPFRGHTESVMSVAISPDGKRIVSGSSDKTIRVWDIEFFNQHPSKAPVICLSSNPTYALHSASSFLQDSSTPVNVIVNEDGWVVGPDGRLLLWIPLNFHPLIYVPGNTLVIPNHASQFDLRYLAHGTSWHMCQEQEATLSSL
ncbi:WD40 repeat-like protein [Suillus weaverae]|nr:WD40 repeat-like protein [Suillus weaverae]